MIKDALKIDRPLSIFERSPSGANPSSASEKWGLELLPGNLSRELPYNFFRDLEWARLSAESIGIHYKKVSFMGADAPLNQQLASRSFYLALGAQWFFASLPMLIFAFGETLYRKFKGEKLTPEELGPIWAPAIAASLAIPMWNIAQLVGTHIGTTSCQNPELWYGSSVTAGMIAVPFVGIFEGFTQWSVKYLADVVTNPVTREMWRQNPNLMGKLLFKEFILNITIGAIPGAAWQVIFFFALPVLMAALTPVGGIIVTAILVAVTVMVMNYLCTIVINDVSASIDRYTGWDHEVEKLRKLAENALNDPVKTILDNKVDQPVTDIVILS
jgi:hypothetical protein